MNNLAKLGPDTDMDMNNLTMRYTMDITGLVGFSKDFATCHSFDDAQTDELFDILRSCESFLSPLLVSQALL